MNALLKLSRKGSEFSGLFFFNFAQKSDIVILFVTIHTKKRKKNMCPYKPIEVYMSILLLYWHFMRRHILHL